MDYTYDATYRLIRADGREHLGRAHGARTPPTAPDAFNAYHTGLATIRMTAVPWAGIASSTCTTLSASFSKCSIAVRTRRTEDGRALPSMAKRA